MSELPLRERKKAATMRRIQSEALALFSQHGFDAVTVEQVAAAADVSAPTVYRYFGTKEGLVIHDEYDERIFSRVDEALKNPDCSLLEAFHEAIDSISYEHFVEDRETTLARMRLWFEVDAVKAAAELAIAQYAEYVAELLAQTGRASPAEGRILATAIIHALVASASNWHQDGSERPWPVYGHEALDLLKARFSA